MTDLSSSTAQALAAIASAANPAALDDIRVAQLGKKGVFTELLKTLGTLPPEERKARGQELNIAKQHISDAIEARSAVLGEAAIEEKLAAEWVDITLPPRDRRPGTLHPISQATEEISVIFAKQGFTTAIGPEIEDDYHNFTALNFPEHHPARLMHDTFFLNSAELGGAPFLLRTHTSPVQIRTMQAGKPPFRFIAPGKTFRCDSDMTHTPMFHQVEGFVVGKGIHMGHLKACVESFLRDFFDNVQVPIRFRPSFFPFTEPSAEVDIGCARGKNDIKIGAGGDWLEVMGCGMIHPNVLTNCGIDPSEWQGFAFGMGVERLAMLKYGIADLRTFYESDLRWLSHYGFSPLGSA